MSEPVFKFLVGQPVKKILGEYDFPGVVVSRFLTTKGAKRYVVEAIGRGYTGMLHIFNEAQLARRDP